MQREVTELGGLDRDGHWLEWPSAPDYPDLNAGEVHVWVAGLDTSPRVFERLQATLTPDEIVRALRFRAPVDRWRSIVARGVLRNILARYLRRRPEQLEFRYGPLGKPALAGGPASEGLRFNLSHSSGVAVYAVARNREVGIDVEKIEPGLADPQLAQHFFSPREAAAIWEAPPDTRVEAFFNCWTRKEAYVKARGQGFHIPPESFEVSTLPAEPELLVDEDGFRCTLLSFRPIPGFMMAIAAEGTDWSVGLWGWGGFAVSERSERMGPCESRFPLDATLLAEEDLQEAARCATSSLGITGTIH